MPHHRIVSTFVFILSTLFAAAAHAQLEPPRLAVSNERDALGLNWSDVEGAAGYTLYYAPYPYEGPDTVASLDMGNARNLGGAIPSGTSYYVGVVAYNNVGTSDYSNIEFFDIDNNHLTYASDVGSFNGLTLIAPIASSNTYLIDDFGDIQHQWQNSGTPKLSAYLLANGNLLRTGEPSSNFFDSGFSLL